MIPIVTLEDATEFVLDGTHGSPERCERGIPVLSAQNVIGGSLNYETGRFTSEKEYRDFARRVSIQRGDLLLTIVGTIGRAAIVEHVSPAVFQRSVAIIRPKPEKLNSRYFFHLTQSDFFIRQVDAFTNKSAQAGVYLGKLKQIELRLPPLAEQRRIAAILDQADALRRKRREALALLDRMKSALFLSTFGSPLSNPKRFPISSFRQLCARITVGVVVKPASYYQPNGVPAIRGTNIKPEGIDLSDVVYFSQAASDGPLSKSRVYKDDLVVVRSGRPGLSALVPEELDGVNAIDIIIATPDKRRVHPEFLRDFLNSEQGNSVVVAGSRGQVQQHFNVGTLSETEIYLPSMELQRSYVDRRHKIDSLKAAHRAHLENLDALFAALQHRAFRGELTGAAAAKNLEPA